MTKFKFVCNECDRPDGSIDPCWLEQKSELFPLHCPHGFSKCSWKRVEPKTKEY